MSVLSYAELLLLAQRAGFEATDAYIAAAVALSESGGNTLAYNPETAANTPLNLGSYGLWQIYLKVHAEFSGQDLFDPQINVTAAFSVYTKSGKAFTAWTTFNNGAYKTFLQTPSTRLMSIPIQLSPTTVTTTVPASELKTLVALPVLISPSPGPGLYIAPQVMSLLFRNIDGYFTTGDHAFNVGWTKDTIFNKFASFNKHGLIDQPNDSFLNIPCTFTKRVFGSIISNAPVYLSSVGSEISGIPKQSYLQVTLTYTLLPS